MLTVAALLLLGGGCRYGYGFAGGGLPTNIRTAAVLPFDNNTPVAELQREIADALRSGLQRRLGLRSAPEARANAIVRGTIVSYDADVPIAYNADPTQSTSARRKLVITVDVEIADQESGTILFARRGLRAEGEYAEGAESLGRQQAIERIVSQVIEGAQSQW
ncbi:MAG TPA: LPS assembly lipoprotein LptE [Gemmatimonadaceae bacterium]|nr:LPS assembly lipoprotein LptE [Gemmatimonadaceae bacterium]